MTQMQTLIDGGVIDNEAVTITGLGAHYASSTHYPSLVYSLYMTPREIMTRAYSSHLHHLVVF